jgi:putative spermidine/putrescine transport system permease protein
MASMRLWRLSLWNIFWLLFAVLYFFVPLWGTVEFSLETGSGKYGFDAYRSVLQDPSLKDSFILSLKLLFATITLSTALMIPTVYWLNLKVRRLKPIIDFLALLPLVVPPIILAVGLLRVFNSFPWLISGPQILALAYVVLALPFTYRSLDAGMRAIDLHTLTEAAQSMGAGWATILLRVIVPNLRFAILSATFLTATLVLGEYSIASLMLFNTFPVYMEYIGETQANPAAALAVISLGLTWLCILGIFFLGRGYSRRQPQIGGSR